VNKVKIPDRASILIRQNRAREADSFVLRHHKGKFFDAWCNRYLKPPMEIFIDLGLAATGEI
jgi:hypothetical protein